MEKTKSILMQNIHLKEKNLRFIEDQGQIHLVPKNAVSCWKRLLGKSYLPLLLKKLNTSLDFQSLTTDEKVALKDRVSKIQNQWNYKKNHSFPFKIYHLILTKIFRLNVNSSCQNILQNLKPKDPLPSNIILAGLRQRIATACNNYTLPESFPSHKLHDSEVLNALFSFGLENSDQGIKISQYLAQVSPSTYVDYIHHCLQFGNKQFLINIAPAWKDSNVVKQAAGKLSFKDLSDEQFEVLFSKELGGKIVSYQHLGIALHKNIDVTQMKRIENSKNLTLDLQILYTCSRNDLILEYGLEMLRAGKPLEQVDQHLNYLKLKESYNHLPDDKFVNEIIDFCEKNNRWDYLLIIRYHFKKKTITGNVFDSALRRLNNKRSVFDAILNMCDVYTRKGLISVLEQKDVLVHIIENLKQDIQYLRDLLLHYIENNQQKVILSASENQAERVADILLQNSPIDINKKLLLIQFVKSVFTSKNQELKVALAGNFKNMYDTLEYDSLKDVIDNAIIDPEIPGEQKALILETIPNEKRVHIKVPPNSNVIPFLSDFDQVEILDNAFFDLTPRSFESIDWIYKFNDLFKTLTRIIENNDSHAKPKAEILSRKILRNISLAEKGGIDPSQEFKEALEKELPKILHLYDKLGPEVSNLSRSDTIKLLEVKNTLTDWLYLFTSEFSSLHPKTSLIPSHMIVHFSKYPLKRFQELIITHFKHLDYPAINKETFQNLSKDYRKAYLNSVFNQVKDNEYKLKDVLKSYKKEGYSLKEILEHTSDELHSMITNGFTSDK